MAVYDLSSRYETKNSAMYEKQQTENNTGNIRSANTTNDIVDNRPAWAKCLDNTKHNLMGWRDD